MGLFGGDDGRSVIDRLNDWYQESREELQKQQKEAEKLRQRAEGDSISKSTLPHGIVEEFRENEVPHYAVYGQALEIEGGDTTQEITADGLQKVRTFATDERILISSQSGFSSGTHTIPYGAINGIDFLQRPIKDRIVIQTTGRTYYCSWSFSDRDCAEEFAEYVREKREETNSTENTLSADEVEKIKQLKELVEDGAISEEEFQDKKSELLEQM